MSLINFEDYGIVIGENTYTVAHSRRKEPNQMVEIWFNKKVLFEVNYRASQEQIELLINTYWKGYDKGYITGQSNLQYQIKDLLNID